MKFPTDYVSPAERLGRLYNYQANHYRFQRQPQDYRAVVCYRRSVGLRLIAAGIVLAILLTAAIEYWR